MRTGPTFQRLALGLCLGLAASLPVHARDLAGELRDAQVALAAGDFSQAYPAYLAHQQDNPLAQFNLGLFHQYGWGRPVDMAESCRWQARAAQGGIPAAMQIHADCLRHGLAGPPAPEQAAHWYAQAAQAGILTAPCELAGMYMAGEGVPKDPRKALELCRQPAEKGLAVAQLRLAGLYLEGDASVRDPVAAFQWMQAAAQGHNVEAQYRLGLLLRDGVGRAADPATARVWLERAASQGWLPAYLPTATLYFDAPTDPATGLPTPENLAKAYLWTSAARQRGVDGQVKEEARGLAARIQSLMPASWQPDLDRVVTAHLARFPAPASPTDTSP
ncbi:MAG: tetratricopeptide repeat protein [Pseudomonadota bacterium]